MLVVEDLEDQIVFLRFACEQAKVSVPVQFVTNGAEAIAYLKGEGKFADRATYPIPNLVLLDLSMPVMDGFEVLKWVRLQPGLRSLRVIVFSTSPRLADVQRAFELGTNFYFVKPIRLPQLVKLMRSLGEYSLMLDNPTSSVNLNLPADLQKLLRNPQKDDEASPLV